MSVASCTCTRRTARRSAAPPGPTGGPARARTRAGGRARARAAAGGRGWRRGRGVWVEQGGGQGELGRATRAGRLGAGRRRTQLETYCSSRRPKGASGTTLPDYTHGASGALQGVPRRLRCSTVAVLEWPIMSAPARRKNTTRTNTFASFRRAQRNF